MNNIELARFLAAVMLRIAAIIVWQQRGNYERANKEYQEVEKLLKALDDLESQATE